MNKKPKIDYKEYMRSNEWQVVRRIALSFAKHKCQVCNCADNLDVHHRTYENLGFETLSDVIVLCRECHDLFHIDNNKKRDDFIKELTTFEDEEINQQTPETLISYDDLRSDIEALLEIGKDYLNGRILNRSMIRWIMEKNDIDMRYHSRICNAIQKKMDPESDSTMHYIFSYRYP